MEHHQSCLHLSPSAVCHRLYLPDDNLHQSPIWDVWTQQSVFAIYQTCFHHLTHSRGWSWTISTRTGNPKGQKQDHMPGTTTSSAIHAIQPTYKWIQREHIYGLQAIRSCRGSEECSTKLKRPAWKFPSQKRLPISQSVSIWNSLLPEKCTLDDRASKPKMI